MKQTELLIVNFLFTVVRILVVVLIGFFMTRILVRQLGLENFGLLTTIGASGMLLAMFTNILQLSIARELGIRVGENKEDALRKAFSSSFFIQLASGSLVVLLGVSLSPLIAKGLTIPEGYERTTCICLILTFIQFAIGIFASPFGGMLRAHQHLRTIAILEMAAKITIFLCAIGMMFWEGDKLLYFVSANLISYIIFQSIYILIALKRFPASHPNRSDFSRPMAKSIFRYASLALMGGIGGQIRRNGIALILNVYFGNIVTAANGIAIRLSNLVSLFIGTINPVIQPAMNANLGAGNKDYISRLIPLSSTIGLAIIIPVVIPLIFETEAILLFWLKTELPEYVVLFSQLVVLSLMVTMISKGHAMALHAKGDIGWLTLINQGLVILGIAIAAYFACSAGEDPWLLPVGELIGLVLATSFWQPFWVSRKLKFSNSEWFKRTVFPAFLYLSLNLLMVWAVSFFMESGIIKAIVLGALSGIICFSILWQFGFMKSDRDNLRSYLWKSIGKLRSLMTQLIKN